MDALISFFQPLRIAIQFLTCLPVGKARSPEPQELGASLLWYPLVGALLGGLLSVLAPWLKAGFGDLLAAGVLLLVWVGLTGALHLDGLADSADAWMGGLGSRKRTLDLMNDPTSGPIAIAALVLVLLLKFCALVFILDQQRYWLLLWPLVFARSASMLLFTSTRYARKQGLGRAIVDHLSVNRVWAVFCLVILVAGFQLGVLLVWQLLFCGTAFLLLRFAMLSRIGGFTGDTAGALIELIELVSLLTFVACVRLGLG